MCRSRLLHMDVDVETMRWCLRRGEENNMIALGTMSYYMRYGIVIMLQLGWKCWVKPATYASQEDIKQLSMVAQ